MDYSEYKSLVDDLDESRKMYERLYRAIETVFGVEKAQSLLQEANQIQESRDRLNILNAVHRGQF